MTFIGRGRAVGVFSYNGTAGRNTFSRHANYARATEHKVAACADCGGVALYRFHTATGGIGACAAHQAAVGARPDVLKKYR